MTDPTPSSPTNPSKPDTNAILRHQAAQLAELTKVASALSAQLAELSATSRQAHATQIKIEEHAKLAARKSRTTANILLLAVFIILLGLVLEFASSSVGTLAR